MVEEKQLTAAEFLKYESKDKLPTNTSKYYVISESADKNNFPKQYNIVNQLIEVLTDKDLVSRTRRLDSGSSERESSVSSPELPSASASPDFLASYGLNKLSIRGERDLTDGDDSSDPDQDVLHRVKTLIEYYMSDDNLHRDMFLLKHINKNREGYISLKLLSKYKKLKRLTKNSDLIKVALKDSATLEIHEDGSKIRRKLALPNDIDVSTPFKIIIVYNIPPSKGTIGRLAMIFGKFGDMTSLQIHKPNGRNLPEVQLLAKEKPELVKSVCAIVEYEKVNNAKSAFQSIENGEELPMKAMEYHRKPIKSFVYDNESAYFSASDIDEPFSPYMRMRPPYCISSSSSLMSSPCASPFSSFRRNKQPSPSADFFDQMSPITPVRSPWRVLSPSGEQRANNIRAPKMFDPSQNATAPIFTQNSQVIRRSFHNPKSFRLDFEKNLSASSTPNSPWVRRRLLKNGHNFESCPNSPMSSPIPKRKSVLRNPKGPDGSKGFGETKSNMDNTIFMV